MSNENVQVFEETFNLPVPLSGDEVGRKLQDLSRQSLRLETLLEDRRESNGRFNTEIKQVRGIIKELAESTNSGREIQPVQVRVEKDFTAGTIKKTRLDTGEVYEERRMTEAEAQMETVPGASENGEVDKPKRGRPKGSKNRPKGDDAQAAPEGANGSGEQQSAPDEGDGVPTHRCLNCQHEFVKKGYYDPKAGDPVECEGCGQKMAKPIAFLQAEEAASNDPPAEHA